MDALYPCFMGVSYLQALEEPGTAKTGSVNISETSKRTEEKSTRVTTELKANKSSDAIKITSSDSDDSDIKVIHKFVNDVEI